MEFGKGRQKIKPTRFILTPALHPEVVPLGLS